jgi:hypothetical protein
LGARVTLSDVRGESKHIKIIVSTVLYKLKVMGRGGGYLVGCQRRMQEAEVRRGGGGFRRR